MLGTFMPWLDQERLGPFTLAPYLFSIWGVIVPNLLVISALFFAVAALTRSMMAAYVAALGFIIANVVVGAVTALEFVVTVPGVEHVIAVPGNQEIDAGRPVEVIVAVPADQQVVPKSPD